MNWTKNLPNIPGFYWVCYRYGTVRMVDVWESQGRLLTNEDGSNPVDDDIYEGAFWYGPIVPPDFE